MNPTDADPAITTDADANVNSKAATAAAPAFAEIRTRAGDVFAAELRQTSTLLLAHAANQQITQLLHGDDQVFLSQSFPPAGALAAPGWANLWDLLPERAPVLEVVAAPGGSAPWRAAVELRPRVAAAEPGADAASPRAAEHARLVLSV